MSAESLTFYFRSSTWGPLTPCSSQSMCVTTPPATAWTRANAGPFLSAEHGKDRTHTWLTYGANRLGGWPSTEAGPERHREGPRTGGWRLSTQAWCSTGWDFSVPKLPPYAWVFSTPQLDEGLPDAVRSSILTDRFPVHVHDWKFPNALILVCWFHF